MLRQLIELNLPNIRKYVNKFPKIIRGMVSVDWVCKDYYFMDNISVIMAYIGVPLVCWLVEKMELAIKLKLHPKKLCPNSSDLFRPSL